VQYFHKGKFIRGMMSFVKFYLIFNVKNGFKAVLFIGFVSF